MPVRYHAQRQHIVRSVRRYFVLRIRSYSPSRVRICDMCVTPNAAARPGPLPVAHGLLLPLAGPAAIPQPRPLPVPICQASRRRPRAVTALLVLPGRCLQPRERMVPCDGKPCAGGQLHLA